MTKKEEAKLMLQQIKDKLPSIMEQLGNEAEFIKAFNAIDLAIEALDTKPYIDAVSRKAVSDMIFDTMLFTDVTDKEILVQMMRKNLSDLPAITQLPQLTPVSEGYPKKDGKYIVINQISDEVRRVEILPFTTDLYEKTRHAYHPSHGPGWYTYDPEVSDYFLNVEHVIAWAELPDTELPDKTPSKT